METTFKDTKGREWKLSLDALSMEHIRDLYHVDLFDPWTEDLWTFLDDMPAFVGVIGYLIEPQATSLKIDGDDFKSGLSGDVISEAQEAFVRARADFIPKKAMRTAFLEYVKKHMELEEVVIPQLVEKIDIDGLAQKCIDSATASLESSGLTRPD